MMKDLFRLLLDFSDDDEFRFVNEETHTLLVGPDGWALQLPPHAAIQEVMPQLMRFYALYRETPDRSLPGLYTPEHLRAHRFIEEATAAAGVVFDMVQLHRSFHQPN